MLLLKCENCGGVYWQAHSENRGNELCDYCENLQIDAPPFAPALTGSLCWLPLAWATEMVQVPQPRPSQFLKKSDNEHYLAPAFGDLAPIRVSLDEVVHFVAYRFIGNFIMTIDGDAFEVTPRPSPIANMFTLNSEHYNLANVYSTIQALFDREARHVDEGFLDAYASWWSSKLYPFIFRTDLKGRGYFQPLVDSSYIVAFCNDDGKVETAKSIEHVPPGSFILATGCAGAICAVIDAQTEIVDGNHFISGMMTGDMERRLERLSEWHELHFPHDEWRLHVYTEAAE